MKKIIAFVLLAALCLTALCSCGGKDVDRIVEMYANSNPSKIVSTTVQTLGPVTLNGTYTLTIGTVGGVNAAIYDENYQQLRSVEDGGATDVIYGNVETVHNLGQYIEGKGVRYLNPDTNIIIQDWNPEATSLVPEKGAIAMNLKNKYMDDVEVDGHTMTFTVPAKHTASVFGSAAAMDCDVYVEIVDNGAEIISVHIEYTLPADDANHLPETVCVTDIVYTYDIEPITID